MTNLFDLNQNELAILEMLENEELSFDDVKDTLDAIKDEQKRKYDAMQKMILSLKGDINTLKERETALSKRRKSYENKIKSLQNYMLDSMRFKGEMKFKTEEFTYFIRKSETTQIEDENVIPEKYKVEQAPKIDKTQIKKDIKAGIEVAGASLVENESLGVR
ncbi:siphovirus Gp157 family protein [Staphylococcus pseudintermedius]|uniref:siphovirus Gp157 family protein n=1 Tax=Staphylococcus pseudintermedius TaxID=283734 RepID=UPI000CFD9FF8|nr:siphovirus Gp157 family protein [Staphylococcus pseudintermedius]EIE3619031.1 siphovirus Gp157 family protein [Staphylococcus pseudintermedius]EIS6260752.1 siphovirus Gp157 family protein [Staphylococcus pseudintermedius]EJL1408901.1 siphovirus Gp157 family protein [Staphylococcus pseudintermedius]NLS34950.1 siphovirus Gp157 family protein [Staphylococcus pseudintermedius]HAR6530002.1 siphovirus Gp157 family protein [Staphylococcus pseudintermedius]